MARRSRCCETSTPTAPREPTRSFSDRIEPLLLLAGANAGSRRIGDSNP